MGILNIVSIVLGSFAIIFTLTPLLKYEIWWIRVFDFPSIQILVFSIVVMGLSIPYLCSPSHAAMLVVLSGCIVYQVKSILPYTSLHKVQVLNSQLPEDKNTQIGIMVTNVLETNRDF